VYFLALVPVLVPVVVPVPVLGGVGMAWPDELDFGTEVLNKILPFQGVDKLSSMRCSRGRRCSVRTKRQIYALDVVRGRPRQKHINGSMTYQHMDQGCDAEIVPWVLQTAKRGH
jgi:hypothetical protein